ncbi:GNAT family N-acetyltransferase [Clostridium saccharoperbutylacetonicum]|uniref:Acetyltransferase, GNAT family n=1 Tax=Clostridium saccharoperbutylacetonicum N1-4(HMT) TaxID=931276 RepID=M1N0W8_9CLOT|nr:GNAT family N-acetyltransferase [Clostridium saccharoperbutylacetonicum]AGF57177.1 acetyltransferase, GNAT family [Clostridium saccharoperbutylacetonicum N1-4(HMT)]AQR95864.1 putative acyltransferase [Clostridium saccharoperbutylacetonicum]NRT62064.1 GNAT superfamily N-acetyltransferase [Clostridium saccharoperbutylacetonicum]NSB25394.1 GNAT superfamily N-acetyltransferase [Clostridium saccharoperbutylacetonicum]NSB31727.1 GNAT superfamily N-acetyltransferase [Clostridium saccharoperbutylac
MNIRQAIKIDLNTIKNITYETIQTIYPHYYPNGAVDFFIQHHSDENISADIDSGKVFILEIDKKAVGTVTINGIEICRLFVLPHCQGKGYGGALIDFSENYISKNSKKVQLDASLPAKGIYLKRGYKEIESHSILTQNGDYLYYDVMEKNLNLPSMMLNYDGKTFIPKINTENGEVDNKTIFNYHQNENVVWAEYIGGDIIRGNIIGTVSEKGVLDFYYQHINKQGQQRIGKCHSVPQVLENGKLELREEWQWLNGDNSRGSSIIVEL